MKRLLVAGLLVIAALFSTAAGSAGKPDIYKATIDKSGVQKITMVGGDFYFKPKYVVVKKNVPVVIMITKEPGLTSHSIVMHAPEAGIDFDVDLDRQAKTIRFTPTKAGTYAFYCDEGAIETHRSKGMEGTLEVTE